MEPTFVEWVHLYFDGQRATTSATYLAPTEEVPPRPTGPRWA